MQKRIFTYKQLMVVFIVLLNSTLCFSQPNDAGQQDAGQQIVASVQKALDIKAERLADSFHAKRYRTKAGKLPRAVSFPICEHAPSVDFITKEIPGEQRMQVYCEQPARWSIYFRGQIDLFIPVLTSRRTMTAGEVPTQLDFKLQTRNISELKRGYLTSFNQVARKQVARRIKVGDIVTPAMLKPVWLVKRGDRVALRVMEGGFEINMLGKALENGVMGKQIRVKNLSSGKILYGIVSGNNRVDIP